MPRLLTLSEAAAELGVKPRSLRTAAEKHGLLVRMGRAIRIDQHDFEELIRKCQDKPREQDSTAVLKAESTSFATRGGNSNQRALRTAERLKQLSRGTSRSATDQPVQLHQTK